jgi:Salmonella virulence plasmid 65kDa B protein
MRTGSFCSESSKSGGRIPSMGGQSDAVSQIISVPQGGGALHGIGEKFAPDLFTGTGNFTVPITLPPGRNGFQPQLSLLYSTGNGKRPVWIGMGPQ